MSGWSFLQCDPGNPVWSPWGVLIKSYQRRWLCESECLVRGGRWDWSDVPMARRCSIKGPLCSHLQEGAAVSLRTTATLTTLDLPGCPQVLSAPLRQKKDKVMLTCSIYRWGVTIRHLNSYRVWAVLSFRLHSHLAITFILSDRTGFSDSTKNS